jgi:chemotaxis protein MotA
MLTSDISLPISSDEGRIDRAVVAGLVISVLLISVGIFASGQYWNFIDPVALLIVLGGTIGATLIHFPLYDIEQAWQAFRSIWVVKLYHPLERIEYLVNLSQTVRRDGLLVLEHEAERVDDPFLRRAFELTVDGQQHQDVKRVLETEIRTTNDRASRAIQVFQTMGTTAPALGLIGTLIGLIQMLSNLQDPASVGPAMSVALVTTLYGAVLANLVFLPTAGKLKNRNDEEMIVKAITIEGVLSIGKQENPMVVEQRLQSFIPISNSRS